MERWSTSGVSGFQINPFRLRKAADMIRLRLTTPDDLPLVLAMEQHPENAPLVIQWSLERHQSASNHPNQSHLMIERCGNRIPVGYVILAGLTNPDQSLELTRIVVSEKGKGYGRLALEQIKQLAFQDYSAHRLWLDVIEHNHRARNLYEQAGFVYEGTLRECLKTEGGFESLVLMSMLQSEYFSSAPFPPTEPQCEGSGPPE